MQPGGRMPAPRELALVQAFANTKDLLTAQDIFTSAEMTRAWLITRGLLTKDEDITEEDFQRALAFREALRTLIRANTEPSLQADALEALNRFARRVHLYIHFSSAEAVRLEPDVSGLDRALGRLLVVIFTATIEGTWERLKMCRNEGCLWAYYDTSKNRSGNWCTMTMCGNRVKIHAYRERRKALQAVPLDRRNSEGGVS